MNSRECPFRRVAIIGAGLIGGSWGLALKRAGFHGIRVGCDRAEVLAKAITSGAIDEAQETLRRAAAGADLLILAAPVGTILRLLPEVKAVVSPGVLITDTGSTKITIMEEARKLFSGEPMFLGGHPLAGKERSGIENADAALFDGTVYVLTPNEDRAMGDARSGAFRDLISSVGARVVVMDAVAHDEAAAWLSHLPQLVSTALASVASERDRLPLSLAATGFRDMTRLAESPYPVWRDICATNAGNIREALDALIAKLAFMRDELPAEALEREFERAMRLREKL